MHTEEKLSVKKIVGTTVATIGAIGAGFLMLRYKVAGPSEYVVRTGLGIKDISVTKKAIQWPFQKSMTINVEPVTFEISVDAMSSQRIPFRMPSVWTIGPKVDTLNLENYARLLSDKGTNSLRDTVAGVIQGETRVLTANLDLNDLFQDRENFKNQVVNKINCVISDLGLHVYNANIAELTDLNDENKFFSQQKKRALQQVDQEARVHVAEAFRRGEIGEYENKKETRQRVALLEKEAVITENERDRDIAESHKDLDVARAEYKRAIEIAKAEAEAAAAKREAELQTQVEKQRIEQEVERQRATEWATANVKAEVKIKESEGDAEAIRLKAEAELYAKQKEAEGIRATLDAQASGLQQLVSSAGGIDGLNKYLLVERNILPQLAQKQAMALQGMNPRVNVWSTSSDNSGTLSNTLTDLFKTGMPLFEGIKDQTGYDFLDSINVKQKDTKQKNKKQGVKQEVIPIKIEK